MTLAAPFFLWAAGVVALAAVAAHLLAWRRPPAMPLPTARFAPERPARVVSRAVRPSDLALLAVRIVMVMLIGIGLARPTIAPDRNGTARVVVIDHSRSAGDGVAVAEAARAVFHPGDAVVVFDSIAREIPDAMVDAIGATRAGGTGSPARGSLSAGLVGAVRAAERLSRERDSVEIVIVSPITTDEIDAATGAIRSRWRGAVRMIRPTVLPAETTASSRVAVRAEANDPVAAALSLVGPVAAGSTVRVVRDEPTTADTAWAQEGGTLVVWPGKSDPRGWSRRASRDTAFAVAAASGSAHPGDLRATVAVIAAFERAAMPPGDRVVARWADGEPAAADRALGDGCIRSVGVVVPVAGDLALTPAFRRFARRMVDPCNGPLRLPRAADSVVSRVLTAAVHRADATSGPNRERLPAAPNRLAAWLLGGALALALLELFIRKGEPYAGA